MSQIMRAKNVMMWTIEAKNVMIQRNKGQKCDESKSGDQK